MTALSLDALPGLVLADRYRLGACLHSGLLSAVFEATEVGAAPAPLLLQLRRPWPTAGEEAAPPAELHDHLLLGAGFTADVVLTADLEAAAGASGAKAAEWLVSATDALLGAEDPDSTSPGLVGPLADLELPPECLAAADHEALANEAWLAEGEPSIVDPTLGSLLDVDAPEGDLPDFADGELPDGTLAGGEFEAAEVTDAGRSISAQDTALEMPILTVDPNRGG